MKRLFLHVSLGALALAVPVLSTANAFAGTTCKTSNGTVVNINDTSTCHFETSTTCTQQCTPTSFTATCSAMCNGTATATCTDTCQTKCKTECTTKPATFTCKDYCSTDCEAGCMSGCTGERCSSECSSSCDAECTQQCEVHPGSTDCDTECHDCCSGSCTVSTNIMCDVSCVDTLQGGCTTQCSTPNGGLFCDGQFIDVGAVTDCNFSINVTATGNLNTHCALSPRNNPSSGALAGLSAVAALGLFVAFRRRRT